MNPEWVADKCHNISDFTSPFLNKKTPLFVHLFCCFSFQATASVRQAGGRMTVNVISFQRTRNHGLTQTVIAWGRTATCWVSRMFKRGWGFRKKMANSCKWMLSLMVPSRFLLQLWVRTQIGTEIYWMGLNDEVVEGVWEWSDGSHFIEYLS